MSTCQIFFKRRQEVHPNIPRVLFSITPSALWLKRATTASKIPHVLSDYSKGFNFWEKCSLRPNILYDSCNSLPPQGWTCLFQIDKFIASTSKLTVHLVVHTGGFFPLSLAILDNTLQISYSSLLNEIRQ